MSKGNKHRRDKRRDSSRGFRELDFTSLKYSLPKVEAKRGIEYQVQQSSGANAEEGKTWVCPECSLTIEPGTIHTVAWGVVRGPSTRRHFHNHCWKIFNGTLL